MAWTFRRRVKVIPGVYINLGKNGISTSIGVRGAHVNFNNRGTFLQTGIPGTGISHRQRISFNDTHPNKLYNPRLTPKRPSLQEDYDACDNIFSVDVDEITSKDMQAVKESILAAHTQRKELHQYKREVGADLKKSQSRLTISYLLLYGFLFKEYSQGLKADIESQKEAIKQIEDQLANSYVQLDYDFEPEMKEQYDRMQESFKALCRSDKIWDITSEYANDQFATRSAASTVVNKRSVTFSTGGLDEIKSEIPALVWENANGADLYFYPNFLVVWSNKEHFAIVGFNEIDFQFNPTRFIEEEKVPADTTIIDSTWHKVNKNGSPDRRFKDNYKIPIVRYGSIGLKTNTGLNERYMFSNHESAEVFSKNFLEYQITLLKLDYIPV